MIPDWKLERYLTGDLPESDMREIREMEAADEIFANRVKMLREDSKAILRKLPYDRLAERLGSLPGRDTYGHGKPVNFGIVKLAAAAALVLAVVTVALFSQRSLSQDGGMVLANRADGAQTMEVAMANQNDDVRIKGLSARMEVWKRRAIALCKWKIWGRLAKVTKSSCVMPLPKSATDCFSAWTVTGLSPCTWARVTRPSVLNPGK